MFFHTLLLQPQHKMQLSLPWKAATLGIKKIKKDDLMKCDVIKICEHILAFVTSNSLNPNKRFSLRLSAILINGVTQILRQQVILLIEDIDRHLLARERTADRILLAFVDDETPPTPKPSIKKKKPKRPVVETPESLVGRLAPYVRESREEAAGKPEFSLEPLQIPDIEIQEEAIVPARISDITLREETAKPQESGLLDDFGAYGDVPVPPSITEVQETIGEVRKILPEPVEVIVNAPEAPAQEKEKQTDFEIQPFEEQQRIEIVHSPVPREISEKIRIHVPQAEKEKEVTTPQEVLVEKDDTTVDKRKKLSDIEQLVETEAELRAPTRKGKDIPSSLLLKTKKKKYVPINQKMQIYQEEPVFRPVTNNIPSFKPLKKFWPEWETMHLDVELVRPARDTGSTRISAATNGSLGLVVDRSAETPIRLSASSLQKVQPIETPSEITTPRSRFDTTPKKRSRPSDQSIEEMMPPAANGEARPEILKQKRRKVVSLEEVQATELAKDIIPEDHLVIPGEYEVSDTLLQPQIRPAISESAIEEVTKEIKKKESPVKIIHRKDQDVETVPRSGYPEDSFGTKWSRRILSVVYKHDKITPVEICKSINEKLTKLNMSIIFASLLSLAKDCYVLLHSKEESSELEFVERGPIMYEF